MRSPSQIFNADQIERNKQNKKQTTATFANKHKKEKTKYGDTDKDNSPTNCNSPLEMKRATLFQCP